VPFLSITSGVISVWFVFWSYRRKYELDYPLDSSASRVRWAMVWLGIGVTLAGIRWPFSSYIRWIGMLWLLSFLAWPNFAYHLTGLLRQLRLVRR
jgi:hypothetical protein